MGPNSLMVVYVDPLGWEGEETAQVVLSQQRTLSMLNTRAPWECCALQILPKSPKTKAVIPLVIPLDLEEEHVFSFHYRVHKKKPEP